MRILSIDSGVERTGYAIFEKNANNGTYIDSGLIQTTKKDTNATRLNVIFTSIVKLIDKFKPKKLVVEQLFFFKNQKTVIQVSQAQGVVMLAASQKGIPVEFLTPLQIKQTITGYGQADKKNVQKMLSLTLKLNGELKQDDQADAIACGLAYCYINKALQ